MSAQPNREESLANAALQLPPSERAPYLAKECGGDDALRQRVEALLQAHEQASHLLGEVPTEIAQPGVVTPASTDAIRYNHGTTLHYFGDYELLKEIAHGGMGVVWTARQVSLNRTVAVKTIRAGKFASVDDVKRFHTEAEAAANLQHPNIVAIHEVGEHEGQHYFSMDYVEGKNLAELVREGPLPPAKVAALLKTIAEAIQYAHQRGILHRDLKPQNILMDATGQPRITDFGLARRMERDSSLTQTGAVMGSPSYMPPEQAAGRNDQVGPASDVYSLGAILYHALTGRAPFVAETSLATLRKVVDEDPERPSKLNDKTPLDLETICLKCLEKKPERRYATARALAEELGRYLNHEPILARRANPVRRVWSWFARHPWIVTGLASLVVMLTLGFAYWMWERKEAVEWRHAYPKMNAPFNSLYFLSKEFSAILFIEFFFLQGIPASSFVSLRARKQRGNWFYYGFGMVGAVQLLYGLDILRRVIATQAWEMSFLNYYFAFPPTVALSNVWLGSALALKAFREARLDLPGLEASEEPVEPPLKFTNKRAIMSTIALEALGGGVLSMSTGIVFWNMFGLSSSRWDTIVGPLGMCGMTGLVLTGRLVARSKGLERQGNLPWLIIPILCAAVSLRGLISPLWYVMPFYYILGFFVGERLLQRYPLNRGGVPVKNTEAWLSVGRLRVFFWKRKRTVYVAAACVVLFGLFLVEERLRGKSNLAAVKRDMAKRGQVTEVKQLFTAPSPTFLDFSNRFSVAQSTLGQPWFFGWGNMVEVAAGIAARGSQAAYPLHYLAKTTISFTNQQARLKSNATNSWEMMEQRYATNQTALAELRALLRDPPSVWSAYLKDSSEITIPNFVHVRAVAQSLNDVAVLHLHQGDLHGAEEDLVALSGLVRMNSKDPNLVPQMIRVAIAGLGSNALWDALQADGWTEPQLDRIQRGWQIEPILPKAISTLHTERLIRIMSYEGLRRMSYHDWMESRHTTLAGFGMNLREPPFIVWNWRHVFFHRLWKFAWADLEESLYLIGSDFWTTSLQEALGTRNFKDWGWKPQNDSWKSPFASWRFHLVFPEDQLDGNTSRGLVWPFAEFDLPDFTRAIAVAVKNENLRQMAVTAIALKRHQLRQGRFPNDLSELVPSLLPEVPVDWMSGQPLRYRLNSDGTYTLYSVGKDGRDDNGDPAKDEVWPTVVPWEK